MAAGLSRLPSVSDDMSAADVEDISASDDQVVDVNRTCAASLESDKFTSGADSLLDSGNNTDDDDDTDEIFQPPGMADGSEMVSSAVTASNEYSGIDVGLAPDSVLSPSSSYDTLPSAAVTHPQARHSSPPSSADDEDEDPLSEVVHSTTESQDEETTGSAAAAVRQGDIGSLTDHDELPVVFLSRMLCSEFLLTGYLCGLLPDHQVRVSVKALALSCLGHLVDLHPQLLTMSLHKSSSEPGNSSLLGPFYGAIVVPSVTRCRCRRRRRGRRCAGGVRATVATPCEWQCKTARSGESAQHFSNASCFEYITRLCRLEFSFVVCAVFLQLIAAKQSVPLIITAAMWLCYLCS